ncbi:MAG: endolytic transglycosylase MltG [Clostridia bacterium]|nr:endolytic transglycosylase MltG [Clostridia bacterium]
MKKNKFTILIIILLVLLAIILAPFIWYSSAIKPADKEDTVEKKVIIELGSGNSTIATKLEELGIIKNALAFKIYAKLNNIDGLQAGTYYFSPAMSIDEIVQDLKTGIVYSNSAFNVTFIEGKSMKRFAKQIAEVTNNTEEDVFNLMKDKAYLDSLISKYWFITDEIKNKDIYYPLEGYLFPDTYNFESRDISVEKIFEIMLNRMDSVLSKYKEDIEKSKYTVHELLALSSLCELEAVYADDRAEVAGVFYNRLNSNDSLGSDVTTYYAIGVELGERDLYQSELDAYNAYNTRGPNMGGKLPVGPISNVSESSIRAAIYPKDTENYFFVADKYGKLYFTKTNYEHTQKTNELINSGMWIEF